jgi:hypothetical protein
MTTEKILAVVEMYRMLLEEKGIPKRRMPTDQTLGAISSADRLAHAHYLIDGIVEYAKNPEKKGKTGRHLGWVQAILSLEGWYTIDDVRDHNRPDSRNSTQSPNES